MTHKYKSLSLFLLIASILIACSDDAIISDSSTTTIGDMTFNVNVLDAPESAHTSRSTSTGNVALEAENNNSDFKAGDSFGLFVIDADGNTVDGFRNMKITTPDGKVWNALSSVKTTVHKMGYKYYAYAPYSADFDNLTSQVAIDNALTAPAADQSTNAATDWMYTGATEPGTNGVTTLTFRHKYGVIDIYNSYDLNTCDWLTTYGSKATKTTDANDVTHYRYILNDANASTLSVSGTYNVGNSNTGIRQFAYSTDIPIGNGYHSTVRTARVSEDYAVDLGLPSGVKWARFNLGAELGGVMTEEQILEAEQKWGTRLAWGELWQKDSYRSSTYIDESNTLFTSNISGTANDPVKMLWGGHWETPTQADFEELKNNVTITKTGPIIITATSINGSNPKEYKNVYIYKLTSNVEGYTDKSITMVTTGYTGEQNNLYSSAWSTDYTYYTSGTFNSAGYHKYLQIKPDCTASIYNLGNMCGAMVRPVLKKNYSKSDIINCIKEAGVDLGIPVTINGTTYNVIWSPVNFGVEDDIVPVRGNLPSASDIQNNYKDKLGWRLAWGQTEKPSSFPNSYKGPDVDDIGGNIQYDAPAKYWGDGWQIPSNAVFDALRQSITDKKTSIEFTNMGSNYYLYKVIGPNGNYIYIRSNGHRTNQPDYNPSSQSTVVFLTSSTRSSTSTLNAFMIKSATSIQNNSTCGQNSGLNIRPVKLVPINQ